MSKESDKEIEELRIKISGIFAYETRYSTQLSADGVIVLNVNDGVKENSVIEPINRLFCDECPYKKNRNGLNGISCKGVVYEKRLFSSKEIFAELYKQESPSSFEDKIDSEKFPCREALKYQEQS